MPKSGYTLIELLIVIAIMSILGIAAFVNYKGFSQDQSSTKSVNQIQTLLREAQANATSSVICGTQSGVNWSVNFKADKVHLDLTCGVNNEIKKTTTLDGVQIKSIQGSSCGGELNPPLVVTYSSLYGNVTFIGGDACVGKSRTLTINLLNLKTNTQTNFKISQGGAINAQ